jgi:hypothetical protein
VTRELLLPVEAARRLNIKVRALRALPDLPVIILGERIRRYDPADIDRLIEKRRQCPSIAPKDRPTGITISSSKVVAFTALRERNQRQSRGR